MKLFSKGLIAAALFALAAPAMAADTMGGSTGSTGTMGGSTGSMNEQHTGTMGSTGMTGATASEYPGVIKNVDQKKNMVTLEVPLAPGATISKDGRTVSLNQIKSGDDVRASFDPQTHTIVKLDVMSKNAMKGQKKGANENMNQ